MRRYHTGPGFFINSYLIFAAINATVWVYLLLALTNSVVVPCGPDLKELCSTLTSATHFLRSRRCHCAGPAIREQPCAAPVLVLPSLSLQPALSAHRRAMTRCEPSCRSGWLGAIGARLR